MFVCCAEFLPLKLHFHAHFNVCAILIMWTCSSKVEVVMLAASVSFLSPAMLNQSRIRDSNKTSTCYKVIIQLEAFYSQSR